MSVMYLSAKHYDSCEAEVLKNKVNINAFKNMEDAKIGDFFFRLKAAVTYTYNNKYGEQIPIPTKGSNVMDFNQVGALATGMKCIHYQIEDSYLTEEQNEDYMSAKHILNKYLDESAGEYAEISNREVNGCDTQNYWGIE